MIEVTKETVSNLLQKYPGLNIEGYKGVGKLAGLENSDTLIQKQNELLTESSLYIIHQVIDWIESNLYKSANISPWTSYQWKHICEKSLVVYVANGHFIAAALLLSCDFNGFANPSFNLEVSPYSLLNK
jgi:hypothetical protein